MSNDSDGEESSHVQRYAPPLPAHDLPAAPSGSGLIRLFVFGSGTGLYLFFTNWSYSAATGGDVITAAVTMFLAWLVGVCALALSEQFGAFPKLRSTPLNVGWAAFLALLSIGLFYYFWLHRPHDVSPTPSEARITIGPEDPEQLKDGTYYRPISVSNEGGGDVNGSMLIFAQKAFSSRPTIEQQEAMMAFLEDKARRQIIPPAIIQDTGSPLSAGASKEFRETDLKFTKQGEGDIEAGKLFPLSGVILVYSDEFRQSFESPVCY